MKTRLHGNFFIKLPAPLSVIAQWEKEPSIYESVNDKQKVPSCRVDEYAGVGRRGSTWMSLEDILRQERRQPRRPRMAGLRVYKMPD